MFAQNQSSPPKPLVYDSVVLKDIRCVHCGYTLKGMKTYQRCRSCNASIKKSLHLGLLIYSDPKILTILQVTMVLIGLATFLSWVPVGEIRNNQLYLTCQPLIGLVVELFTGRTLSIQSAYWHERLMPIQPLLLGLAAWLLTQPRLPVTMQARRYLPEWPIRPLVLLPILGPVLVVIGGETENSWVQGIGTILCGTLIFTVMVIWNRLRDLAFLIQEPRLFSQVRLVRWILIAATVLAMLSILGSVVNRTAETEAGNAGNMVYLLAWALPAGPGNVAFLDQLIQYAVSWPLILLCLWALPVMIWFVQSSHRVYSEAREAPHDVQANQSL